MVHELSFYLGTVNNIKLFDHSKVRDNPFSNIILTTLKFHLWQKVTRSYKGSGVINLWAYLNQNIFNLYKKIEDEKRQTFSHIRECILFFSFMVFLVEVFLNSISLKFMRKFPKELHKNSTRSKINQKLTISINSEKKVKW